MTKGTTDACCEATIELALAQKGYVLFFPYWKPGRCLIRADRPGGISKSSAFRSSGFRLMMNSSLVACDRQVSRFRNIP